jgi:acetolactate synthase I/II/III large subunit
MSETIVSPDTEGSPRPSPARIGGHVVAETLQALGTEVAFGVPGVHALAIWEGLRDTSIRPIGTRTELCAGFMADGYARSGGRPGVVLLSTGPGAMNSLTAVMEAASAHVPLVLISSQIPSDLIGRGRGYLHELPDQLGAFATLAKSAERANSIESIPGLLQQAFERALTPPSGPVFVEIPVDLLTGPAGDTRVDVEPVQTTSMRRAAPAAAVAQAATLLGGADAPVLWAGGGVIRSDARAQLRALAELLGAPVATTYMGKGAIADDHPLAVGAGCDEAAFQELLSGADVVLCVGTELGAETTGQYELGFGGRVIHLDAAPERIGVTYDALALVGDARATLEALIDRLRQQRVDGSDGAGVPAQRVVAVRERIAAGLAAQGRELELGVLATVRDALAADAIGCWDMTILGYWAAPHLHIGDGQQFLYPLGSGTLGYGWPAALGARIAHPDRQVLGIVGDGGFQYAVAELGTAAQHGIGAKLLIVDDGGYGILREYQRDAFGTTTSVELPGKDLVAIAAAYAVPVCEATPDDLGEQLAWARRQDGPAVVVLRARLAAAAPTR